MSLGRQLVRCDDGNLYKCDGFDFEFQGHQICVIFEEFKEDWLTVPNFPRDFGQPRTEVRAKVGIAPLSDYLKANLKFSRNIANRSSIGEFKITSWRQRLPRHFLPDNAVPVTKFNTGDVVHCNCGDTHFLERLNGES